MEVARAQANLQPLMRSGELPCGYPQSQVFPKVPKKVQVAVAEMVDLKEEVNRSLRR